MILNNKSTNPFGYTVSLETKEQKEKIKADMTAGKFDPLYKPKIMYVAVFPGVTGNVPKELLDSPAFIEDSQNPNPNEGIEIIDENTPIEKARLEMTVAEAVKLPYFDVVEFCTNTKADAKLTAKQIHAIENLYHLRTLDEINKLEKRSNVLQTIERQYRVIETSIKR